MESTSMETDILKKEPTKINGIRWPQLPLRTKIRQKWPFLAGKKNVRKEDSRSAQRFWGGNVSSCRPQKNQHLEAEKGRFWKREKTIDPNSPHYEGVPAVCFFGCFLLEAIGIQGGKLVQISHDIHKHSMYSIPKSSKCVKFVPFNQQEPTKR